MVMGKAKILIVEDEVIVAEAIKNSLESMDYEVTSMVKTGASAVESAEQDRPNIILMDIRLKGQMDGIEAAELIRSRSNIPIIFLTAYADEDKIDRAKLTLPFGYVLKPFQDRDLKVAIEMAIYIAKTDSERRQAESKQIYQKSITDGINIIFEKALTCQNEEDLSKTCLSVAEKLSGSKFGWIGVLNQNGRLDTIAISNPGWDACQVIDNDATTLIKDMNLRGIWSIVLKDEKSCIINNPSLHPASTGLPRGHPEIQSFMGVPLKQANKTFGMIALANKEGGYLGEDQEAIEALSAAIVEAIMRIRAEERRKKAEKRYRNLFEEAPIMYVITRHHNEEPYIVDCNELFVSSLGYSRDQILNKPIADFFTPESVTKLRAGGYRRALDGLFAVEERQLVARDGRIIETALSAMPDEDAEGKDIGTRAMFLDITKQKRAEEALRESEESLAMAQEIADIGSWDWKIKDDKLTWSDKTYRQFGLKPGEIKSSYQTFESLIHPEDREMLNRRVEQALKGEKPYSVDARMVRTDGTEWIMHAQGTVYRDKDSEPIRFVGTQQDITNRVRAGKALRESEERYRSLVENSLSSIILHRQEEMLFANERFFNIFGYEQEELQNLVVDDILAPEIVGEVAELRRRRLAGEIQQTSVYESKGKRKDGEIFDMEISVCVVSYQEEPCCMASLSDMSKRKQAEEDSKGLRRQNELILNAAGEGIYGLNLKGNTTFVNPAAFNMIGWKLEEIIGKNQHQILHHSRPDGTPYPPEECPIYAAFKDGKEHRVDNEVFWRKDGSCFPVEYISRPIFNEDGKIEGAVVTFKDITERRRAEEEKNKLETKLQQAQKMESIGTLAGGIAHDFNNILSPIMIHTEMAMIDLSPDSHLHHHLKQIYVSSQRARDLVKQVLTFSRQRHQELIPLKLSLVVKENIKLIRSTFPSTIEICQDIKTESDTVLADPTQINQVLLNLCTNASHAMREAGGELTISLNDELLDSEDAGKYSDLNPGSYLRLTVSDTGHGIEPEVMNQIFEPYFTTKNVGEGTGMGLAMIHGIVKSYGGDITVESEPGKGTTFHVLLPRIEADVSPIAEHKIEIPKGSERILFVDDEKVAVDAFQQMLENLGYKVTARTSSIEALEAFRHNPDAFDLVITDMTMPNMTGKELAKELMAIRSDIPIVLCTGFSEQIDKDKAKAIGISAFVMKPIVMHEIAVTIREVLDKE